MAMTRKDAERTTNAKSTAAARARHVHVRSMDARKDPRDREGKELVDYL